MENNCITVRLAQPVDAEELCRMNAEFNGPGLAPAEMIRDALSVDTGEIVAVAEFNGCLAGFCCAQVTRSFCYMEPSAELTELYVRADYRRRGCASWLVRFVEQICRARGAEQIRLLTGRRNLNAQKLYTALGYTPEDEILYVK